MTSTLAQQLGHIDIYLLDQLLRGRIRPGMRIFDAGCGHGRNVEYFLREGYAVAGADESATAIDRVRALAATLAPELPASGFRVERLEALSFDAASAEVVIANAVLHFARDDRQFTEMLEGCWRLLALGGLFFARLTSTIGLEGRFQPLGGRRYVQPDGSERYLVDQPLLLELTERLGGRLLDPLKTTVVQDQRSMTTWVVQKSTR